jgi:hypothetical protein
MITKPRPAEFTQEYVPPTPADVPATKFTSGSMGSGLMHGKKTATHVPQPKNLKD